MWITERCRLLDSLDIETLVAKLVDLPEEMWQADAALRQALTLNRQTSSIYLKSISADDFTKAMEKGHIEHSEIGKYAGWDVLHAELESLVNDAISHYPVGGVITRIQLARLKPGAEIKPHVDQSQMLIAVHRLHLPLITNEHVTFTIDGSTTTMAAGKLYELNNRLRHSVVNNGTADRIHLIIDYLPPEHNLPEGLTPGFELRRKQRLVNATKPPPAARLDYPLPRIIASSVVRGAHKRESHGGIYLVDLATEEVEQVIDWNTCDIAWEGRGWDRGLRGIAIHEQEIFVAASDELFCFDRSFKRVGSWRCPFLKHAHEIFHYGDHLLVTSTGFDSILRFNLKSREFDRGWVVRPQAQDKLSLTVYDPRKQGPPAGNRLHVNNVCENASGMYISARGLPFLLRVTSGALQPVARLPAGTHNAMPFRDGVLYNDTNSDLLVYEAAKDFCYLDVPRYPIADIEHADSGDSKLARQAFGRGLCAYQDDIVIAGSSPSTITAWDLLSRSVIKSVNITMDIRNAIHGLEIWSV